MNAQLQSQLIGSLIGNSDTAVINTGSPYNIDCFAYNIHQFTSNVDIAVI